MKEIPLTMGKVALVDDEDYERVMRLSPWATADRSRSNTTRFYAIRWGKRFGIHGMIYMHRFILDVPPGVHVDHRDGNGLRNTRDNIRLSTPQQNHWNRISAQLNTSSRFKGVHFNKSRDCFQSYVTKSGRHKYLGRFTDECEAALAYDKAARELFGEFARTNFPLEG